MELLTESIEHEMGDAFEVKDPASLHRCALLLAENIVTKAEYTQETGSLHEDIREGLAEMRTRFDAVDHHFEASIRTFEILHEEMNARFDANDRKFELLHDEMNKRFETQHEETIRGFEAADKKIELLRDEMRQSFETNDKRFEDVNQCFENVNKRFDDTNKRFDQMVRLTGLGITALALLITAYIF